MVIPIEGSGQVEHEYVFFSHAPIFLSGNNGLQDFHMYKNLRAFKCVFFFYSFRVLAYAFLKKIEKCSLFM